MTIPSPACSAGDFFNGIFIPRPPALWYNGPEKEVTAVASKEHILVGLSPAPSNERIIRTAATMAAAFRGSFTALFVETPQYAALSQEDRDRLRQHIRLAQSLGARVETVFGEDVSFQIGEYARLSGVTKIVVGRSAATRRHPWSKPTLTEKLTAIAPNLDIHIIPDLRADSAYRPRQLPRRLNLRQLLRDWAVALGILGAVTALAFVFSRVGFTEANIITVYLLGVLATAMAASHPSSYVLLAVAGVLAFSFLFTTPRYSFKVYEQGYPVTIFLMLCAALLVGSMTDRLKSSAHHSAQAAYRTNLLLECSQLLQKAGGEKEIFLAARTQLTRLLNRQVGVYPGIVADPGPRTLVYPIRINHRIYGSVTIPGGPLEAFENSLLLSILGECALALENSRNAREKEEAARRAENEKLRANLLRSISHDLRTPLTAISGYAGILLQEGESIDPAARKQMYTDIYEDAGWLHNLVENLLAVTKIEEGRVELNLQPQLAEEIVSEALTHISRRKTCHTIAVSHQDEFLLVPCDARLMVQALVNLVDNAIKYCPPGSRIAIATEQAEGFACFHVTDNGPGIPDGEKEKVFGMFYTGAGAVADSRRSLGLGLSLCRSIAAAHGGRILLTDAPGGGCCFTVKIPTREVNVHE